MLDIQWEFLEAMNQHGIPFDGPVINNGELHKFKATGDRTPASWYILFRDIPAGKFGCHRRRIKYSWHPESLRFSKPELETMQQQILQQKRKKALNHLNSAEQAFQLWKNSKSASNDFQYLIAKSVYSYNLRQCSSPCRYLQHVRVPYLLIPVWNPIDGHFQSLQAIDSNGSKCYFKGGKISGGYFPIGKIKHKIYVAEGYATAATVHYLTKEATAAAFNNYNLINVAKSLRQKYSGIELVIVGDNDWQTERKIGINPGVDAAEQAARAVNGKFIIPAFN